MSKITIYMPNFNYANYIEEAVNSVLKQSYKDWELLIIDDGSTDNSLDILKKYNKNKKIKVIKQKNKGLNVTNNIAIRLSNSEYITRLDPDDYLDENYLLVVSKILDNDQNIGLVYPDYFTVDKEGNILNLVRNEKINIKNAIKDTPPHGACTMFRRDILINIGSYDEVFKCQDGYDIWLKFIDKYNPYNINLPLFYYRRHNDNSTNNQKKIFDTKIKISNKHSKKKNENFKVLAIVPITKNSMYDFNKPFVVLDNKPLLWYTLDQITKSKNLNKVIINTDDEKVISYVEKYFPNFLTLKRQQGDGYEINDDLISDSLKFLNNEYFDYICKLYISTPLRKAKHIDYAISTISLFNTDYLVSVSEELSQLFTYTAQGLQKINNTVQTIRFERDSIYRENGSIYIYKFQSLTKNRNHIKIGHIKMLNEESVKLNTSFDFDIAEYLLKKN
ncbi:glycosyltransferase [Alphaproteobacteria bacterium]|jgi:CMP-N-acetylneuraminic acid synthetase|nr:glycosyltransferase [Alphaproteobacteria bacterium]